MVLGGSFEFVSEFGEHLRSVDDLMRHPELVFQLIVVLRQSLSESVMYLDLLPYALVKLPKLGLKRLIPPLYLPHLHLTL